VGARLELASTEIADLQALNQHVIDSLPSGLLTTDPMQRILTFNHAAEMICGLPFSGLSGACQLCMSLMGRRRAASRQRLFRRRDVRQRLAYAIQRPHPAT